MKIIRTLALLAIIIMAMAPAAIPAATFTPYNPTPHAAEVDLDDIILAQGPGWVRIPDDLDTYFPVVGYEPTYLIAWEDLPMSISDNDFNDVVLKYDSLAHTFQFIAGYSSANHTWYEAGGALYLDSSDCCGVANFSSLSNPDRMLSWGKETAAVPEPTSVALLGAGLLGLAVMARRRRQG